MELDDSDEEYIGEQCSNVYSNKGCGAYNMPGEEICSQCKRILQSPNNIRGDSFALGQSIFFHRNPADSGILEEGIITKFIKNNTDYSVLIKYKYGYVADKFDEVHPLDLIFFSVAAASTIPRVRRTVASTATTASEQKPELKVEKSVDSHKPKHKVDKPKPQAVGESVKMVVPPKVISIDPVSLPAEPKASAKIHSLASLLSESSDTPPSLEMAVRPAVRSCKETSHDTSATTESNNQKRKYANLLNASEAKASCRRLLWQPVRGTSVDDILSCISLDTDRYAHRSTTAGSVEIDWKGAKYRTPLDCYIKRGLVHELSYWAQPPRSVSDIERLKGQAWLPDMFVIELEQIVQGLPLTLADLMQLPCGSRLSEIPLDYLVDAHDVVFHDILGESSRSDAHAAQMTPDRLTNFGHSPHEELQGMESLLVEDRCSSVTSNSSHKHFGEVVADIVCSYLARRGVKIDASLPAKPGPVPKSQDPVLERLHSLHIQTLPMQHDHFLDVLDATFYYFGGRHKVEGSKDIKGCKVIEGKHAMYGGVMENVIEKMIEKTRMTSDSVFYDVGSGIGQICIQVAATVGCKCFGVELDEQRYNISVELVKKFDELLEQLGVIGRIGDKIQLINCNLVEPVAASCTAESTVIFFDNFGSWFSKQIQQEQTPIQVFCEQLYNCRIGTQICALSPLIEVSGWLHCDQFDSGPNGFSWTDKAIPISHYTLVSHEWTCEHCTLLIPWGTDECELCGKMLKTKRTNRLGSQRSAK